MLETPLHSKQQAAPIADSEDQIRNLKSSESVTSAFQGQGMPAPPPGVADIIASFVKSETRSIKIGDMKNMAPGSGSLGTSASSAVNMFLSMLTPAQREAAKAGVYPLDADAVARFQAKFNGPAGALAAGTANGRVSSTAYDRSLSSADMGKNVDALLKEGFSKQQIADVLPYAKQLGWNDRDGLRDLAGAGKEFAGLAAQLAEARKRGDHAGEQRIQTEMEEQRQKAKGKQRKHMDNVIDRMKDDATKADYAPTTPGGERRARNVKANVTLAAAQQQNQTTSELDSFGLSAEPPAASAPATGNHPVQKKAETSAPPEAKDKPKEPERPKQTAQATVRPAAPSMGG